MKDKQNVPYIGIMGIGILTSLTSVLWILVYETKAQAMIPVFAQLTFGICLCVFCLLSDPDLKEPKIQKVKSVE